MNNNNNSSSNTTNNNNNNKASKKWRSIDEMERAFERAEKGLEFPMANGYREEMEKKRENCASCKSTVQKGKSCDTCGTPGTLSDVNELTLQEVWTGLDSMCDYADKKRNEGNN